MASIINTALGFEFKKGVLNAVVGNLKDVKHAALSVSSGIADINKKLKNMASVQSIAALGLVMKNTAGSIKSAALGIRNVYDSVTGVAERGDRVAKTSRMLGLDVKEYQAFGSAAKHSGMSIEDMDSALKKFNVTLGKARSGDKTSSKIFDSILPKGKKLSDYKNTSSLVQDIADSYTKLTSAEQKAFVTQELFGRGGQKMSELFKDGSSGIRQMFKDFEDNGGGFDKTGAENAELFNDELQKMQEYFDSIKVSVMQELFPTFIGMFKDIRSYLRTNGDELKTKLVAIGTALSKIVVDFLPKMPVYLDRILGFVDKIGADTAVSLGLAGYFGPVLINVAGLIFSAGKAIWRILSFLPKVFSFFVFIKETIQGIVFAFRVAVAVVGGPFYATLGLVVAAVVSWGIAIKSVYDNFDLLKSFVKDDVFPAIQGVAVKIGDFFAMVGDKFLGLFHGIESIAMGIASAVSNFCMNLFSGIIDFVKEVNDTIKGVISVIPGKLKSLFGFGGSIDVGTNIADAPSQIASAVQQSYSVTTNRFAVDFNNVPRGTNITPPPQGDFEWSRSYTLGATV